MPVATLPTDDSREESMRAGDGTIVRLVAHARGVRLTIGEASAELTPADVAFLRGVLARSEEAHTEAALRARHRERR
jgi:hypothetical protein